MFCCFVLIVLFVCVLVLLVLVIPGEDAFFWRFAA